MRIIHLNTVPAFVLCVLLTCSGTSLAQNGTVVEGFELGDSQQPEVPGTGDVVSISEVPGPDWEELFNADGSLRDEVDAQGNPTPNGIPDFVDRQQGRLALFVGDDISAGSEVDLTIRFQGDNVNTGPVDSSGDLSNAYFYVRGQGESLVLYGGLERITPGGPGSVELELNQDRVRLGRGWPATTGWEIVGNRTDGDVRLTIGFDGEGQLTAVDLDAWQEDEGGGGAAWIRQESLNAEGCNAGDTFCTFRNASTIPGGEWASYDSAGQQVTQLGPDCFFEFGVHLGGLLGLTDPGPEFDTVQLRTSSDLAFGYFGEVN